MDDSIICKENRPGKACLLWTKNGCSYEGKCRKAPTICYNDEKEVCDFLAEDGYCDAYARPDLIWRYNQCCLRTFGWPKEEESSKHGKKLNPLKASKRKKKGMV